MADAREKRISVLLNESRNANIDSSRELTELISDYFLGDGGGSDDDISSDDEAPDHTDTDHEADDDSESCEPLVHVEMLCGDAEEEGDEAYLLTFQTKAANFSCKCKQIKVVAEQGLLPEQRRGCISQFTVEEVVNMQFNCRELSKSELDLFIIGVLSTNMKDGDTTSCSRRKEQSARKKSRTVYSMLGRIVCRETFMFFTGISLKRLSNIMSHYKKERLVARVSKSGGRKSNTNSLSHQDIDLVCQFILNYAEDHGVSLPGRIPGFKRDDIKLLPSSATKSEVHRLYSRSCAEAGNTRAVAKSTFTRLWKELLPFVVIARPMTDLCWVCQRNNLRIFRGANITDQEKMEFLLTQQQHLSRVEEERQLYRQMTAASYDVAQQNGVRVLSTNAPCSRNINTHYSFDFAQQVHIPSNPAQPGPICFLTPRKCGIFGVHCEGVRQQVNYLIDEGASISKGSNAVISYLHHFFETYGLGEINVDLHCDNCSGQNKNRFVLWYFAWRVMAGLHQEVTLNFMPPGHTKFSPDWCFGLIKRTFRRSEVSCLNDMCEVVRRSTPDKHVNIPQLVGREDGHVLVVSYDWQEFLRPHFRVLPGIKKLGFTAAQKGVVYFRETLADQEESKQLCTDPNADFPALRQLPPVIPPPGLSLERKSYLYKFIREFVRDDAKDIVAPNPGL